MKLKHLNTELRRGGSSISASSVASVSNSRGPAAVGFIAASAFALLVWLCSSVGGVGALWGSYLRALGSAPLITKICTAAVCAFMGDTLAQLSPLLLTQKAAPPAPWREEDVPKPGSISSKSGGGDGGLQMQAEAQGEEQQQQQQQPPMLFWRYDAARAARIIGFNMVVAAPVAHFWFALLDRIILPGAPTSAMAVVGKTLADQLLLSPAMTCTFFAAIVTLEGRPDRALDTIRAKIRPTLIANYTLWPAAHLINFSLVPLELRVLYVNVVAIFWTLYLSTVANKKE